MTASEKQPKQGSEAIVAAMKEVAAEKAADDAKKSDTLKGLTASEFDGVTLGTLRAWVRFWSDEKRATDEELEAANAKFHHEGFTRQDHVRVIEDEIAARVAKREAATSPAPKEAASA